MGYIKEPKGIDFLIKSEPLTEKDKKEISKFIAEYKMKSKKKVTKSNQNSLDKKVRTPNKVQTQSGI